MRFALLAWRRALVLPQARRMMGAALDRDSVDPRDGAMADSQAGSRARAERLFEEFLHCASADDIAAFDQLRANHPDLAPALAELRAAHEEVRRLLPGPLSSASRTSTDSLLRALLARGSSGARYQERGEIGRGGMGIVLRVRDSDLRRDLAMKVARRRVARVPGAASAEDRSALDRFLEEAQVTSQLDHPGIVPVHEIGVAEDGTVYYTMRLVRGVDLRVILERVRSGGEGWTQIRALGVLVKVCEAMSYAHSKGVLHRDLKPANVMVGEFGEVYVMDWGLARVINRRDLHDLRLRPDPGVDTGRQARREAAPESPLLTMDGDVVGTAVYMAPEQARGEIELLGPRADVYSVGAMLYELISGSMPYVSGGMKETPRAILDRLKREAPAPLHELARAAPPELVAICEKAMARPLDARYADMAALANDLRAFVEGRVVSAYETGAWAEARKWVRRNRALAASLAAVFLILMIGAVVSARLADANAREARADNVDAALRTLRVLQEFRDRASSWEFARDLGQPAHEWWLTSARALIAGTRVGLQSAVDPGRLIIGLDETRRLRSELLKSAGDDMAARAARASGDVRRQADLALRRAELLWQWRMLDLKRWPDESSVQAEFEERVAWSKSDAAIRWLRTPDFALEERDIHELMALNLFAFNAVRFDRPRTGVSEVLAYRLARHLVDTTVRTARWESRYRDTLAFTLFRIGRFDKALAEQRDAVAEGLASVNMSADMRGNLDLLERAIESWSCRSEKERGCARLALDVEELERAINSAARYPPGSYAAWLDGELTRLEAELVDLGQRATLVETWTTGAAGKDAWDQAIAAVQADVRYRGIALTPQVDLHPIGIDPVNGLAEFAHLPSGEIARRDADGRLRIDRETGLVFVLLPGGKLSVATGATPSAIQECEVAPFFLSKFEMTEQQWDRLDTSRANRRHQQEVPQPVSSVSWIDCSSLLSRAGGWLCLPDEVMWEYGCRGGTTARRWTGDEAATLVGAVYSSDVHGSSSKPPNLFDASRSANPFGLHDTLGSLAELCQESLGPGVEPLSGVGLEVSSELNVVVARGGSYADPVEALTSSHRRVHRADTMRHGQHNIGLRPARLLTP